MVGTRNGGFVAYGRPREKNSQNNKGYKKIKKFAG